MTGPGTAGTAGGLAHLRDLVDSTAADVFVVTGKTGDAGLDVGYSVGDAVSSIALLVPVDGQLRPVKLTPAAARRTAGRLAVRADEVDIDHAEPLTLLAHDERVATLRKVAYSVLPPDMDDDEAATLAGRMVEMVLALGWAPRLP